MSASCGQTTRRAPPPLSLAKALKSAEDQERRPQRAAELSRTTTLRPPAGGARHHPFPPRALPRCQRAGTSPFIKGGEQGRRVGLLGHAGGVGGLDFLSYLSFLDN